MRVLDIGKMVMKWSSINGDTVFMIKIFNRVAVENYTKISVLVEHSSQAIVCYNPFSHWLPSFKKPAHWKNEIKHGLFPLKSFYRHFTMQIIFLCISKTINIFGYCTY